MPEEITEKKIRARLSDGQARFGDNSIRHLLSIIDGQRGTIAMHEANADEAALKAARREAEIERLKSFVADKQCYADTCVEIVCAGIDDGKLNLHPEDTGPCARLDIELRNLRAQVAEARAAGHPVNLFEELAVKAKQRHICEKAGVESGVAR